MKRRFLNLFFIVNITLFLLPVYAQQQFGNLPQFLKRDHFVLYHDNRILANELSWKAEYYYKQIIRHLNVRDFDPFENEPCPIYLYKNRKNFIENTAAPEWSSGMAVSDPVSFATYEHAENFKDKVLPHELAHILLFILMRGQAVPLWLNEGLAQYEEADFGRTGNQYLKRMIRNGDYIKLQELFAMREYPSDERQLRLFYAQSASVVEFFKERTLRRSFGEFLLKIKRGVEVDTALKQIYQWKFRGGIPELEERWIDFVNKK